MQLRTCLLAVGIVLTLLTTAQATTWVSDFSSTAPEAFTGSDSSTVVTYANPLAPPDGTLTWAINTNATTNVPAGWLTQGTRDGAATTARFYNGPGNGGGRARLATVLPNTLDATGGIAFAWTARYGNYVMGRGPIQLAFTSDGGPGTANNANEYNAYIRCNNGVTVSIQTDGGGAYANLGDATLATSVADGAYHQWSVSVIVLGDGLAHWKLWVDGVLVEFPGSNGAHDIDPEGGASPQRFSFKTPVGNFTGPVPAPGAPYIGLGELASTTFDLWDFEFDCVAYRDDGLATNFTCGQPAQSCRASVSPAVGQTSTALKAGAASPASHVYTVLNSGLVPLSYTVAETDQNGNPQDYTWLALDNTGGGPLPIGESDTVTATITDTDLPHGTHTAYVTFTDGCTPAAKYIRQIDLVVTDCAASVYPPAEIARSTGAGSPNAVADAVFTLTNTGTDGLTYNVQEDPDCAWLTLDKSAVGPLNHAASDAVTASITPAGLAPGVYNCTLRFTNTRANCTNVLADLLRTVTLHVVEAGTAYQQFNAEFTEFTGSDMTSSAASVSCDPGDPTSRLYFVDEASAQVGGINANWLTQGSIDGVPTTAKFWNIPDGNTGRARFRVMQGFDERYDPAKGLVAAWRMKVGNYAITRGPFQLVFGAAPGPQGTDPSTAGIPADQIFSAFVRIVNGNTLSILTRSGSQYTGIDALTLPTNIADEYHQWTMSVCLDPGTDPATTDDRAYWNLWLDGVKLLFSGSSTDGTAGSPVGPGGQVYSFRTISNSPGGDPFVSLGDIGNNPLTDIWDMEFDWVRIASWSIGGCPFWDGAGCMGKPFCNRPMADYDGDKDVDMLDFAAFQRCLTTGATQTFDLDLCRCMDSNKDSEVNEADFLNFMRCATGPGIAWTATPGCP